MFSLSRKLGRRLQVLLEAMRSQPQSLLDPYLWKVLVSPSRKILSQTPYFQTCTSLCQKLRSLCSAHGVLSFPIDYYGKHFELYLPSHVTDEVLLETIDLWLPYLCQEKRVLIEQDLRSLERMAYPGMAWEITGSPFRELYLNPKEGIFWGNEGPYDDELVRLQEGDYVLDIGAHMGLFTVLAGKVVGEKGRVFAFEPLADAREKLLENVALNNLTNVTVVPKALGDRNTTVAMEGISIVSESQGTIECTTLDAWVEETKLTHLDFLKMDVEGFERKVLAGGLATLRRFKPRMGICIYHLPDDPEVLQELIMHIDPGYHIRLNSTGKKYLVHREEEYE